MGSALPSTFTHPYPDRQTVFSPPSGAATKFVEPSAPPVPRPRPDVSEALPYASEAARAAAEIDDEISKIERRMRTDRRGYFRDEDMQKRYRELLTIRGRRRW